MLTVSCVQSAVHRPGVWRPYRPLHPCKMTVVIGNHVLRRPSYSPSEVQPLECDARWLVTQWDAQPFICIFRSARASHVPKSATQLTAPGGEDVQEMIKCHTGTLSKFDLSLSWKKWHWRVSNPCAFSVKARRSLMEKKHCDRVPNSSTISTAPLW